MRGKKPTRRQKEIMYRKLGLDPTEWLVVRWLPDVEYITLINRFTDKPIQKINPEVH